jgi:tetratricopeptide (TPR) repeat protein
MYLELGDVDQAIYYWDQMALLEQNAAFDLGTRIRLYSALKQWDTAYDLIQKYISLYPDNKRDALKALGLYHTQKREFEKALDYFKEAEKLPPGDYEATVLQAKLYHGIALYLSGVEEDGESMLRDCLASYLELNPRSQPFDIESYIAGIYTFLGNKEEAYNWLRRSNWRGWSLISQEQGVLFTMINGEKEFQDIVSSVNEERKEIREEIARLKAAGEWEI